MDDLAADGKFNAGLDDAAAVFAVFVHDDAITEQVEKRFMPFQQLLNEYMEAGIGSLKLIAGVFELFELMENVTDCG